MDEISVAAERIERAALEDLHAAASAVVREALGLRLDEVGGALVSIATNDPSTLLNRTVGIGFETPATPETVAAVVERYAAAGVKRYYIHLHPEAQPAGLRGWLGDAGLVKYRGWVKFHRGPEPPPERTSEFRVENVGPRHGADFGRIVAPCFDMTDAAAGLLAALPGRPGWHVYLSFADDQPAGTGTLFVQGQVGYLDWGSTHRDFRGRGGQGAVLARRIEDAIQLGCRHLVTATGEAVAGDPQHSYRNIMRMGFQPATVRENFIFATEIPGR
jgi:GNAT superfamily N-acetyltransferase